MAPKRPKLLTIALAATKGGVGKTTIACALAVEAAKSGARVALLDTDPQLSLARWHELRGFPANPKRLDVDASSEAMALVQSQRWDYLIIDTPPAMIDRIEAAVFIADVVIVPLRPSGLDAEAVRDVVFLCEEYGKRFAFLLNQVPESGYKRIVAGTRKFLEGAGPILKTEISLRKVYVSAMTLGKSGPELNAGKEAAAAKEAADEMASLWAEILAFAGAEHG